LHAGQQIRNGMANPLGGLFLKGVSTYAKSACSSLRRCKRLDALLNTIHWTTPWYNDSNRCLSGSQRNYRILFQGAVDWGTFGTFYPGVGLWALSNDLDCAIGGVSRSWRRRPTLAWTTSVLLFCHSTRTWARVWLGGAGRSPWWPAGDRRCGWNRSCTVRCAFCTAAAPANCGIHVFWDC
jgi:hypothetical protein